MRSRTQRVAVTQSCHLWPRAQVMCCDYGFRSGNMRLYQDSYGSVPRSVFVLVTSLVTLSCLGVHERGTVYQFVLTCDPC